VFLVLRNSTIWN